MRGSVERYGRGWRYRTKRPRAIWALVVGDSPALAGFATQGEARKAQNRVLVDLDLCVRRVGPKALPLVTPSGDRRKPESSMLWARKAAPDRRSPTETMKWSADWLIRGEENSPYRQSTLRDGPARGRHG